MPEQCQGKYHGSGIKYVPDGEILCEKCKQEMKLKEKRGFEVGIGSLGALATVGGIIHHLAGKKNKKDK